MTTALGVTNGVDDVDCGDAEPDDACVDGGADSGADGDDCDTGDAEPDDVREGGDACVVVDDIFVIILYIDYINFLNSI